MTLAEFGRVLGVQPSSVSQWENGLRRPAQYHEAAMQRIKDRLDRVDAENREKFINDLLVAGAAAASVYGLLSFLFSEPRNDS